MPPIDVTERLVDVVALLLRSPVPLTHREISERLEWVYGGQDGSDLNKRLFDRDKEKLREWGYELDITFLPENGGAASYKIHPDRYFLAGAGLTPEEQLALRLAAASSVGGARDALDKLGGRDPGAFTAARWLDPGLTVLGPLLHAVAIRATVTFRYRDGHGRVTSREVDPWGLLHQDGYWYLVCFDRTRDEQRTLRADRIDGGLRVGDAGTATNLTVELGAALDPDPKQIGDSEMDTVLVAVHPDELAKATDPVDGGVATGDSATSGPVAGWPLVEVAYRNVDGLRSWLIGFGPRVKVLSPQSVASWYLDSLTDGRQ